MNDLLPKMIVKKKPKEPEVLEPIPKEKLEQNQVFEGKTTKKESNKKVTIQDEITTKEVEEEIEQLEEEIEKIEEDEPIQEEQLEPEPEPEPIPMTPREPPSKGGTAEKQGFSEPPAPVIQPIKEEKTDEKPKKVDKRKGKPSQARLEHLARIREKAAETRRMKAAERRKQKENPPPQPIQQPIYNHNITPEQMTFAINHALEIQEKKRLARKEEKKKKKEEEAVLLKKQKEEEEVKKKVMKAVNIPRQGEWDFCFR